MAQLPYELRREEYELILDDVRHLIAPELGRCPTSLTAERSLRQSRCAP
ncbi:hypothetical protein PV396_09335 [Streptomyces sp. ME02-8801-2C]|nr:hypothetical protein [Streptomyces sp. ME02-8801-2C]MDX3452139.1 hypothetical protein [Streptomyces sp. ME02-8801-2C]